MPRLGHDGPGDHQPVASAYSPSNQPLSIGKIALILFGLFTLRNILFHDYRSEEVSLLKASGKTEEQIDTMFVPRTASERRQRAIDEAKNRENEIVEMKQDIEKLKEEVKFLKGSIGGEKKEGSEEESKQ